MNITVQKSKADITLTEPNENEVLITLQKYPYRALENAMQDFARYAKPYNCIIHYPTNSITVYAEKTSEYNSNYLLMILLDAYNV